MLYCGQMLCYKKSMDTLPSEQLLIKRIKDGDLSAYDIIVSRYWDRTYARVIQLLNNKQDAEEVTQDAFIRAQRGLDSFRGGKLLSERGYIKLPRIWRETVIGIGFAENVSSHFRLINPYRLMRMLR